MSSNVTRLQVPRLLQAGSVIATITLVMGMVLGLVVDVADASHGAGGFGPGDFEIDGDITSTDGLHDWDAFLGDPENGEMPPDGTAGGDTTFFDGGQTEADYPGWTFTSGAAPPKADLHRLFVASQLDPAGSFIWLGATRVADEGNVQVTVEFNQAELTFGSFGGAYRQAGDFYIRFNFPGNSGADVDVYIAVWDGSSWGTETLLDPAFFRDAVGTIGANTREFVEIEINLASLTGPGGTLPCGSFGSVSFRSEASGGNNNNNNPTLKDIAGPFAIDLDTCAAVGVLKLDEEGNPLSGAEFTLYEGSDTSGTVVSGTGVTNPCTTDTNGECAFGTVLPGTYTVDETGVPDGYRKDPTLPETFDVAQNVPVTLTYTDPRIPYTITVDNQGENALDDTDPTASEHEFIVTLEDDLGPLDGETIDLAWTGTGEIVEINGVSGSGTSCVTDTNGQCSVVVNSTSAGSGSLEASWDTPYQNTITADPPSNTTETGGNPPTAPYETITDSANKAWYGLGADITADGLNLVGEPHEFTVYVWEMDGSGADDGTEPGSEVSGATVTVSWSGPAGSTLDGNASEASCVTDGTGTCTLTAESDAAGTGVATITEVSGNVTGGETATTTYADGPSATKMWIAFRAVINPDGVNVNGDPHDFIAFAEYTTDGTTWNPVPDGSVIEYFDDEAVGDPATDTCDSTGTDIGDAAGECTITVTSDDAGTRTVTVTGLETTITENGITNAYTGNDAIAFGDGKPGILDFDADDYTATKTWLDYDLVIDPSEAVNEVGDPHTFVATLTVDTDAGPVAAAGETLQFSIVGVGEVTGGDVDDTLQCTTDTNGQCAIEITSDEGGVTSVVVAFATLVGDTPFAIQAKGVKTWASIDLVKTAVVGDELADGDLIEDPGGGPPILAFSSDDQGPKTAVFEYVITNTGGGPISNLELVDNRLGEIGLPEGLVLEVGESFTVRASEQYTYADALGIQSIINNVGTVTGLGEPGAEAVEEALVLRAASSPTTAALTRPVLTAIDDADIQLVAVQSSILIDLVKDVVAGEGDVEDTDAGPLVSWSDEELEAGVTKTVRYRFTITNIGNSQIVDVELTDPMISDDPIISASEGVTLDPGESTTVEVDYELTTDEAFPDGPIASKVDNVATVTGANASRDSFASDTDDATVLTQVVFAEVLAETGLGDAGRLLPVAVWLLMVGAAALWLERRWSYLG